MAMKESDPSVLSERDERLLNYLALIATVLRQQVSAEEEHGKHWWDRFLEPGVLTALVTVLIGGIMGNIIAGKIQTGAKEREFQQAWMKARGDQALLAYKEHLDQERETVKRAYELVGGCISASEDLIDLTRPEFAPRSHVGIEQERDAIRKNYNDHDVEWRRDHLKIQLLVSYYHSQLGQREAINDWEKVQASVTAYMDCARDWYIRHDGKEPPNLIDIENSCKDKKDSFNQSISQFTLRLERARRYAWEGWESPERLRSALEQSINPTLAFTPEHGQQSGNDQ